MTLVAHFTLLRLSDALADSAALLLPLSTGRGTRAGCREQGRNHAACRGQGKKAGKLCRGLGGVAMLPVVGKREKVTCAGSRGREGCRERL